MSDSEPDLDRPESHDDPTDLRRRIEDIRKSLPPDLQQQCDPNYSPPDHRWQARIDHLRRILRFSPAHILLLNTDLPQRVTWRWDDLSVALAGEIGPKIEDDSFLVNGESLVDLEIKRVSTVDDILTGIHRKIEFLEKKDAIDWGIFVQNTQPIPIEEFRVDVCRIHPFLFPFFVSKNQPGAPSAEGEVGIPIYHYFIQEGQRLRRSYYDRLFRDGIYDQVERNNLWREFERMEQRLESIHGSFENVFNGKSWSGREMNATGFSPSASDINVLQEERAHILDGLLVLMKHAVLEPFVREHPEDLASLFPPPSKGLTEDQTEHLRRVLDAMDKGCSTVRKAIIYAAKEGDDRTAAQRLPPKSYKDLSPEDLQIWEKAMYNKYTRHLSKALATLAANGTLASHELWTPSRLLEQDVRLLLRRYLEGVDP